MTINILQILPVGERGGAERIHESWVSALSPEFCIHVILPKSGQVQQVFENLGINVIIPHKFRISNLVNSISFLNEYIKSQSIDLIHSSMGYGHLFGGAASFFTHRCKEVWSNHGPMSTEVYQGLIPLIPSSTLLVHSQYMYNLQKRALYNAKRLRLVPCGVDTNLIYPNLNNKNILRDKYHIPPDAVVIGIVGRVDKWKGQDILLKALHKLKKNHPYLYCFIVGGAIFGVGNNYHSELIKLSQELEVDEHVIFTGHVDNVYDYYDLLDIVVHASLIPEPFGLVVAEAMAKGKVVVATTGGGPSEMIKHGANGFLYTPGNVEELSNLLSMLLNYSFSYLEVISKNARESIMLNFSLQNSVNLLKATYLEALHS